MRRVRCMFVLPSFAGGGAERVMLQMVSTLPQHAQRMKELQ
jgi:hypothetical protein